MVKIKNPSMEDLPMEDDKKRVEISLPPEIIEYIHSLTEGKEAIRMAVASKSLYNAWSKRPNVDFNLPIIPYELFSMISRKTMERYEDCKLKIKTLTLLMGYSYGHEICQGLIVRAIKLGVINLKISTEFEFWDTPSFALPVEVLGSETLASLSLNGCIIDSSAEVNCSVLKSLHLSRVAIIDGDLFTSLILRCPLIEKLVCDADMLSFSNVRSGKEFHRLESLSLNTLRNRLFFQDLFLKFPFLKNLAIRHIYDCGKIRICSQSLLRINIVEYYKAVTVEIDAPNIRRFHFEGSPLSCLAFETTVRDWDLQSSIRVMCYQPSSTWLSSLRKLLLSLSQSKVSLSILVKYPSHYVCDYTGYDYAPTHVVENLKIMEHAPNSGLLDGLFMVCRPKVVTVAPGKTELLKLLCEKLVDITSENDHCIPNPSVHGLEEVNVEVLEEKNGKWRSLPLKTLQDASLYHENMQEFRFQLRWRVEIGYL